MAEISLHGVDIEFDRNDELCFDLGERKHWFYLTAKETVQLRDFLSEQIAASQANEIQDCICVDCENLRRDAARFVWWFSDSQKPPNMLNEFLQGVREHWTVDQWRIHCDRWMVKSQANPGTAPK